MGSEIELKLEVPPQGIRKLRRLRSLRNGSAKRAQEKDLVSVYFDTPKHKLRRKGMSLRVRHIGDKRIQTLKANGQWAAGLSQRDEWEKPIKRDTPDLRAVRRTALAPLLSKKFEHALKPVFETRVHRAVLPLHRGDSRIELTLDQGQVRLGRKSTPISEVELELKGGRPADLLALARDLWQRVPARFAVRSKADRGYDLIDGRPVAAVRAQKITLAPNATEAQAFRTIALACTHQVAANEAAVSAGDPDGVHQMRVGLRRLRAAIAVFSDLLLDDAQTAAIKAELKWLTDELGPARDLDVYIRATIKPLQPTLPAQDKVDALLHALEARRGEAFRRAKKAVGSARYRALMLDTLGWIVDGPWSRTGDELVQARRDRRATDFAREEITRRARKARKQAGKIAKLDPHHRHKLRIAVKKLRYAIGFFASLFAGRKAQKRLRRFAGELKALQDCLGALNDIVVHDRLAGEFVHTDVRRDCAFAIGLVSGRDQSRIGPLQDAAVAAGDRFVAARAF